MQNVRPRMAILSTHDVECGIAYYNGYIASQLKEEFDVTVLPLDQSLFRQTYRPIARKADAVIRQIAKDLPAYDVVVIQLEYGIFGTVPRTIWRRLKPILKNANKLIIVFHTFLRPDLNLMKFIRSPSQLFTHLGEFRYVQFQGKLIRYLRRRSKKHAEVSLIVQTRREQQFIETSYGFSHVFCHPLAYLSQARIEELNQQPTRKKLLTKYGLDEEDVLVGFFGFVTKYKGVETAMRAVLRLQDHYKLIIFGGIHPGAIRNHQNIDGYLGGLVKLSEEIEAELKKSNITSQDAQGSSPASPDRPRIIFAGHQKNEEFESAFHGCDFVVLPYLEVGQTSSGPASIAMQLEKKTILSRTLCYAEFARFADNTFHSFDIGNHVELSQCFQRFEETDTTEAMRKFNQSYNLATRAQCYVQAFQAMTNR